MSAEAAQLSLIIPAFNESRRIAEPLRAVGDYLARQGYPSEILIVDDGSLDDTADAARHVAEQLTVPVRCVRYEVNRGKGYALKVGFDAACGQRILFTDADLSTPIEETSRLLEPLDRGAEIAIATRKSGDSNIAIHQPRIRELCGQAFTLLVRQLLVQVTDVTCGFKAFRADVGKRLFAHSRIRGWSFDAEILFIAHRFGYRIVEVPVRWEDREGTRVNIVRDAIVSLAGLMRIRLDWALGSYANPSGLEPYTELWRTAAGSGADVAPSITPAKSSARSSRSGP